MTALELEAATSKTARCECCGSTTTTISGWVHDRDGGTRCAYIATWADDGPHPPHLTMGYGAWGEGTAAEDRVSIYAERNRGRWRLVDHPAPAAPADQPALFGRPMPAKRVRQDASAGEVRDTLEFIVDNDDRLPS